MCKIKLSTNIFPDQGYADPHAIVENGRLYVFCGHDKSPHTEDTWTMDRWEILSSDDLINWKKEGIILPTDTYIGDYPNCWAGDIVKKGHKYYWYFSNKFFDTGVMISDAPTGPFVDALDKPLLPNDIIEGKPYDPSIIEVDGVYTIFFSAGTYYAATLGDDMISLKDKPQAILVIDQDGKVVQTDDKSTVFKRDDNYYLVWGSHYAMSKVLKGPYTYKGAFIKSNHNSVFKWLGEWYITTECEDLTIYYRGICIKPLSFNDDGTVNVPPDDQLHPIDGRQWTFEYSDMGFTSICGTSVDWDRHNKSLRGTLTGNEPATLQSFLWPTTDLEQYHTLILRMKNQSSATQANIQVASIDYEEDFWNHPEIDWEEATSFGFQISSYDEGFKEYKIDLKGKTKSRLKRLRIQPALGASNGKWEIDNITIY